MAVHKKRGLGRGLDALLGGVDMITQSSEQEHQEAMQVLPIEHIQRGQYQPRKVFSPEALQELAESITAQGVIQPVVVRSLSPLDGETEKYELIAGERRWRAAQLAGLHDIPAIVRQLDDNTAAAIALIENVQREDLNPLEEASALLRLQTDFDMTHQQIAEAIGRSRAAVSNLLRLHDLHSEVKQLLHDGQVEMGHARALLSLSQDRQPQIAAKVVSQGLSVRQTEALVRQTQSEDGQTAATAGKTRQYDADAAHLEQEISDRLGAPVTISCNSSGKGALEIRFTSIDELQGILNHIH